MKMQVQTFIGDGAGIANRTGRRVEWAHAHGATGDPIADLD